MIRIINEGKGLTFEDWIDVYDRIEDNATIGAYYCDDLNKHEMHLMHYIVCTRGKMEEFDDKECRIETRQIPEIIKLGRGIGSWHNSQYIIICETIPSVNRIQPYAWMWRELPAYKRMKPFLQNQKSMKFFYKLSLSCSKVHPDNTYVTTYRKPWANDPAQERDIFFSEIREVIRQGNTKKIITLGFDIPEFIHTKLNNPVFYSDWRGHEWERYHEKFCHLICG